MIPVRASWVGRLGTHKKKTCFGGELPFVIGSEDEDAMVTVFNFRDCDCVATMSEERGLEVVKFREVEE